MTVSGQGEPELAAFHLPDFHQFVVVRRHQTTIRTERQTGGVPTGSLHRNEFSTGLDVPDLDQTFLVCCGQPLPVGSQCQTLNQVTMPEEIVKFTPTGSIPDLDLSDEIAVPVHAPTCRRQ